MIILIVIGVLILIVVTGNYPKIIEAIYGPYTVLIAVIMLVEYLILKGGDRSDLYRRELEVARHKRRDDLLALREMETQLVEMRTHMHSLINPENENENPEILHDAVVYARSAAEELLGKIRERI
jgi:purine-cytosine permease-like protein